MDLIELLDLFVGALLNVMFAAIVIRKIFKVDMNKNNKVKYIALFLTSVAVCLINKYNRDVFKLLITIPTFTIGMKYIFNSILQKSLVYMIVTTFYMFLGEIIVGIVFSLLPVDYLYLFNNVLGRTFANIFVIIMTLPFIHIKIINKIFNKITYKIFNDGKISNKTIILAALIFSIAVSALGYRNALGVNNILVTLMDAAIFIVFIIMAYMSFKESQRSDQISQNYNVLFTYLEKYEKELMEKRKLIHDYKNQLIVINGYIGNDKKLREYIEEIIDDHKNITDSDIILNIDKLPSGLKGLLYYKFSQLDNRVNVDMNIDKSIVKFEEIPARISKDILKIIGVLIDNSIEAVEKTKLKNIFMDLSIQKNVFKMELTNSCNQKSEKTKIMEAGFSTKGKKRGYGLSLVKDIVKKNDKFNLNILPEEKNFSVEFTVKI